jgi:hypothetical protein
MRYNLYLLIFIGIIVLASCAGTHGKIKSYSTNSSMIEVKEAMMKVAENANYITFFDNTDGSGINRKGYIDILIETSEVRKKFKIHFYGNETFWEENPDFCSFAIIKINLNTNAQFSMWSKEKRIALEIFEKETIPRLENILGEIEVES